MSILDYFPTPPLPAPRAGQVSVLKEVESAIEAGYKTIIVEAPVGAGKSGIAMAIARWAKSAHILTPMKSLQNQYFEDFSAYTVLMKGRSSYPCVAEYSPKAAAEVRKKLERGELIHVERGQRNCGQGPCKDNLEVYNLCVGFNGEKETTPCPYTIAIEKAQSHDIIVHNLHSYIYQTHFGGRFSPRRAIIIDEAHRIEGIIRDFAKFSLSLPGLLKSDEESAKWSNFECIEQWSNYFTSPKFLPHSEEDKTKFLERIQKLEEMVNEYPNMWNRFAVRVEEFEHTGSTKFELTPEKLGGLPQQLLYSGGEICVLMSGTIYDKAAFCRDRGINESSAYFIRIGSTFPVESRPIIMKDAYLTGTSHAQWADNLPVIAENIRKVLAVFKDVKGLIHAPSYRAAAELVDAVKDPRLITHIPEDFNHRLEEFYAREDNSVFVSPVCAEGVDFKFDRARFQIILRIPYLNAVDEFVDMKIRTDFPWYTYQALITFGQQLGRVNRSEKDFGVTVLLDDRFPKFISRNKSKIPKWVRDAIKQ